MISNKKVLAVIMGGGRGTRLYPLTKERCKPAVPLAGKYRLVDIPISNCLNSEINRIFLLTQFNTASLHRHIQNAYHFDPFGGGFVDILSADQSERGDDWYQGTADAVRRNLYHFRNHEHEVVLVLSGDQLYRMDFRQIIAQHIATGADVTIAAKPISLNQVEGLGLMRVSDDLRVQEFVEKPKERSVIEHFAMSERLEASLPTPSEEKRSLASMGIYVFNKDILAESLRNTMTDFGKEVIPSLLGKAALYSHIFDDYWEDIGTVSAFFEANLQLADPLPPFNFFDSIAPVYTNARYLPPTKVNRCSLDHVVIGDGSLISDATLNRCVIGIRSILREGTVLKNVIMMGADLFEGESELAENAARGIPDIGIGRNCRIEKSIIDKNARIGNNVVLSPEGKPNGFSAAGVTICDGVLVVCKGVIIPDNTVI